MYLLKNLNIGTFRKTIPIVPKYDNCNPISLIANGLFAKMSISEIAIEFKTSGFL